MSSFGAEPFNSELREYVSFFGIFSPRLICITWSSSTLRFSDYDVWYPFCNHLFISCSTIGFTRTHTHTHQNAAKSNNSKNIRWMKRREENQEEEEEMSGRQHFTSNLVNCFSLSLSAQYCYAFSNRSLMIPNKRMTWFMFELNCECPNVTIHNDTIFKWINMQWNMRKWKEKKKTGNQLAEWCWNFLALSNN